MSIEKRCEFCDTNHDPTDFIVCSAAQFPRIGQRTKEDLLKEISDIRNEDSRRPNKCE